MASSQEDTVKTVKTIQVKCWPDSHILPQVPTAIIELLDDICKYQYESRLPVCVMSKNGVSRCGIFCSLSICYDKLKAEGEVDVFYAVKNVKTNRPQLVENIVEYVYCYTFMLLLLQYICASNVSNIPLVEGNRNESETLRRQTIRNKSGYSNMRLNCLKRKDGRSYVKHLTPEMRSYIETTGGEITSKSTPP